MPNCRNKDCQAPIFFATTEKGRQMPLDLIVNPQGKWAIDIENDGSKHVRPATDDDMVRYTSHFETCKFAKRFSRKGPGKATKAEHLRVITPEDK